MNQNKENELTRAANDCPLIKDPIFNHQRWGYKREDGEWITEPIFSVAENFEDGIARIRLGITWGYLNEDGSWRISPQFDYTEPFIGSVAGFNNKGFAKVKLFVPQLRDNKWGLIDTSGKWIVSPAFDSEEDVRIPAVKNDENKLYPSRDKDSGLWGWKKYNGEWAILPIYQEVTDFVNNRASFLLKGKWGVTDEKGWKNKDLKSIFSSPFISLIAIG